MSWSAGTPGSPAIGDSGVSPGRAGRAWSHERVSCRAWLAGSSCGWMGLTVRQLLPSLRCSAFQDWRIVGSPLPAIAMSRLAAPGRQVDLGERETCMASAYALAGGVGPDADEQRSRVLGPVQHSGDGPARFRRRPCRQEPEPEFAISTIRRVGAVDRLVFAVTFRRREVRHVPKNRRNRRPKSGRRWVRSSCAMALASRLGDEPVAVRAGVVCQRRSTAAGAQRSSALRESSSSRGPSRCRYHVALPSAPGAWLAVRGRVRLGIRRSATPSAAPFRPSDRQPDDDRNGTRLVTATRAGIWAANTRTGQDASPAMRARSQHRPELPAVRRARTPPSARHPARTARLNRDHALAPGQQRDPTPVTPTGTSAMRNAALVDEDVRESRAHSGKNQWSQRRPARLRASPTRRPPP